MHCVQTDSFRLAALSCCVCPAQAVIQRTAFLKDVCFYLFSLIIIAFMLADGKVCDVVRCWSDTLCAADVCSCSAVQCSAVHHVLCSAVLLA